MPATVTDFLNGVAPASPTTPTTVSDPANADGGVAAVSTVPTVVDDQAQNPASSQSPSPAPDPTVPPDPSLGANPANPANPATAVTPAPSQTSVPAEPTEVTPFAMPFVPMDGNPPLPEGVSIDGKPHKPPTLPSAEIPTPEGFHLEQEDLAVPPTPPELVKMEPSLSLEPEPIKIATVFGETPPNEATASEPPVLQLEGAVPEPSVTQSGAAVTAPQQETTTPEVQLPVASPPVTVVTSETPLVSSAPPASSPASVAPSTPPTSATTQAPQTPPTASAQTLAINGFGRIGRTAFRVWWKRFRDTTPLVAINTSGSSNLSDWAHLLKFDSNYGVFSPKIEINQTQTKDQVTDENPELGTLTIEGKTITVLAQRDPAKIPWAKYGVTTVIESTGKFVTQEAAGAHLQGGAQRVVVSAPPKGEGEQGGMPMILLGVQETLPTGQVISNASCTTNCVAPVVSIMQSKFGIEKAMLTTIHAYTDDQNLHDNSHKDMRRARAAATNIVPTSTGAARAVGAVIPEVAGKFDGLAVRVPVPVGSLSDMVFVTSRDVTVEEVVAAFEAAAQEPRWKGILAATTDQIVSHDIVGRPESSIVDLSLTQVVGGNLVKVVSWYDNEYGYCNRLVEVAAQTSGPAQEGGSDPQKLAV